MEMLAEGIVSHCACRSRIRSPGLTGSGSTGVVVERDGMKQVFIGGTWIGQFEIAAPKAKYGNLRKNVDFD
jgi:hypothetical protein